MMEPVANILNVKDVKKINQNISLSELGMDSMMIVEIKQILEQEFDIFFTVQEIRNLTFAKLDEISKANIGDNNTQIENSIDGKSNITKLFGIVEDKDFMTKVCLDIFKKEENTIQVFLIPGIDGCVTIFNHLASSVKFSMTSLQCNINNINAMNTLSETVHYLVEQITSRLKDRRNFVMVGYSFGSIIAIELTRKLESMNFKGRLVFIDDAPDQVQIMYEHYMSNTSDIKLQNDVLITIMEIYKTGSSEKILQELKKYKTWNERLNIFAKHFLTINTLLSPINLNTLCTTVYKHLLIARQYNPSTLPRINSSIMLLKATLSCTYD